MTWGQAFLTAFQLGVARAARPGRLAAYAALFAAALLMALYMRAHPELMPRQDLATPEETVGRPLVQVFAKTAPDVVLYGTVLGGFLIPFAIVGVALALAVDAFASDAERAVLPLILARATPRSAYFLGRHLACDAVLLLLAVPTTLALYFVTCREPDPWLAYAGVGATLLAVVAYTAVFSLFAQAPRAALGAGLVWAFVWEQALTQVDVTVRALALSFHLRGFIVRTITEERFLYYQIFPSAPAACMAALGFAIVATVAGVAAFGRRQPEMGAAPV